MGDILYNLSASKIIEVNEPEENDDDFDGLDDDEIRQMFQ